MFLNTYVLLADSCPKLLSKWLLNGRRMPRSSSTWNHRHRSLDRRSR